MLAAGGKQSLRATHPEIALAVFENLKNAIVGQPVLRRDGDESAILEAIQAAVARAHPERPFAVFVERADARIRQALLACVGGELVVFETVQTARARADPQAAVPGRVQ